ETPRIQLVAGDQDEVQGAVSNHVPDRCGRVEREAVVGARLGAADPPRLRLPLPGLKIERVDGPWSSCSLEVLGTNVAPGRRFPCRSGCPRSTPVSITATLVPAPWCETHPSGAWI